MKSAEPEGKTAPCDKCGTVKRVFQADRVAERKSDIHVELRRRWLCATCYRETLPV